MKFYEMKGINKLWLYVKCKSIIKSIKNFFGPMSNLVAHFSKFHYFLYNHRTEFVEIYLTWLLYN